jgi:2-methylcitrate dehydratase PrpD
MQDALSRDDAVQGGSPTALLAGLVSGLTWSDIDDTAREQARCHLLDTLGATLAGSAQPAIHVMARTVDKISPAGDIPVPGMRRRYDLLSAAYLSAACAHGLEIDDGFNAGALHPGCVIVSAAMALGLARNASGTNVLTAMVAGYEVSCRVAALGHPATTQRSFHNTAIVGTLGAAAVASNLLGFSARQTEHALGIAASASSGLFSFAEGGEAKRTHPANAARQGVLSALLAEEGLTGPPRILEQANGWFKAFAGDAGRGEHGLRDAGGNHPQSSFAIANTYIKPHACCRHVQSSVDLVMRLMTDNAISAGDVTAIHIRTYRLASNHARIGWSSQAEAQLSFPYIVAAAIARGKIGLDEFSAEARADSEILRLAGCVRVSEDPECEQGYPAGNPVKIDISLANGRTVYGEASQARGGFALPLSPSEIEDKFRVLSVPVLGEEKARQVSTLVGQLPTARTLQALSEALSFR